MEDDEGFLFSFPIFLGLIGSFFGFLMDIYIHPFLLIGLIFLIAEIIFLKFGDKPTKNQSHFWFAAEQKVYSVLIAVLITAVLNALYVGSVLAFPVLKDNWQLYITGVGYVVIAVVVFAGYVWLNSLKYRNVNKPKGSKKK